jgi:hypothetical protein
MKEEQNRRAANAVYSAPGDAAYVASHTAGVLTRRISWGAIIGGTIIALVTQITLSLLGIGIGASTIHVQSGQTRSDLGSDGRALAGGRCEQRVDARPSFFGKGITRLRR